MIKRTAFAALIMLTGCGLFAEDTFSIGGKEIVVPPPEGYIQVTDGMPLLKRFFDQFVDPVNDTLAVYVPPAAVAAAAEGRIPELSRYFALKVNKSLKGKSLSEDDFEALRSEVVFMQEKTFEEVKRRSEDALKQAGKNVGREFDVDMAIGLSGLVPLSAHHSSKDMVAFSMLVDYGVSAGKSGESKVIAATSTMLDVSGSLALLYAFGKQADLEWTRSTSLRWGDAILAANGLPVTSGASVGAGAPREDGFEWNSLLGSAVAGALIGGAIAIIISIARRRRKS